MSDDETGEKHVRTPLTLLTEDEWKRRITEGLCMDCATPVADAASSVCSECIRKRMALAPAREPRVVGHIPKQLGFTLLVEPGIATEAELVPVLAALEEIHQRFGGSGRTAVVEMESEDGTVKGPEALPSVEPAGSYLQ